MSNEAERARPAPAHVERKLTAILHADVQGYSRLLGKDEVTTLRTVASHLALMRARVGQHGGRAIGSRGDSLLAEFPSVVQAVQGAVQMQQDLKVRNAEVPLAQRVEFRMGINVGEVVVEGEEIYGEGVNIAVRLEGLADAGGICLSEVVYDQVRNRLALAYEALGEQELKNIAKPVRVWRVRPEESGSLASGVRRPASKSDSPTSRSSWLVMALVGLLLLTGTFLTVRYLSRAPLSPQDSALRTAAAPAALPLPDKPSIVVLPFVNMSKDPDQEYFSDGLTEDLTTALAKVSALFVIARNSAFTYKGKPVDIKAVSRELGVHYVLEGSVQRADNRVRITAQLVDGFSAVHVWAESYDRDLKDIFAVQDEVRQKIVLALKVKLTPEEQERFRLAPTDNLEAYDALMRGGAYYLHYRKETNIQARQLFEKALELDPKYAAAYANLGATYWVERAMGWSQDPQMLERAFALTQQSLALDDSLPTAHVLLGDIYLLKKQHEQAIAEAERGIVLNPNFAFGYSDLGWMLSWVGRSEETIGLEKKAMRLDPYYPVPWLVMLGDAYQFTGRYEEAIATGKKALARNPDYWPAYVVLTASYWWQWLSQQSTATQTLEPAIAAGQRAVALNDSWLFNHIELGHVYLYQQQYEQALAEMERAVAFAPAEAESSAALAEVLSYTGRAEEALAAAAQALRLQPLVVDNHLAGVGAAYAMAGRYAEAIAPLQRYLSRYPNRLPVHLMLTVVYSELGQAAEARAEAAEVLRLNPNFSLEVHKQRMPIKDPAVLERHLAALRKAGLK